ncbi:MAG: putative bifunctional diguanylate cyclase/phosphodiesterase [Woeseiaceae bacterium]
MALLKMPTTLKRGVGRKILSFFLLAGLLPVALTASLAYLEVERGMYEEVGRTLRADARAYGQDLLGRIRFTSTAADDATNMFRIEGLPGLQKHKYLLAQFENVWFVDGLGRVVPITGTVDGSIDRSSLGRPLFPGMGDAALLAMSRKVVDENGRSGNLIFQFDSVGIWGESDDAGSGKDFCVLSTEGAVLHCGRPIDSSVHQALVGLAGDGVAATTEWEYEGEDYLGAMWQLNLADGSAVAALDVLVVQPASVALQTRADFSRVFVPALVLVVILVGVLSFSVIGKSLTPLQRLTAAVRQITAGNLDARLRIRSGDEFEWLAKAFNKMATKLGGQISTLKAMSEIDQQILSGAKFEQVSECVLQHLVEITGYEAAAVIARDDDRLKFAKLISAFDDEILHERIALPVEMGHSWCQPRQVSLEEVDDSVAPYRDRFLSFGTRYVALIPVVLQDDLKGILLLGSENRLNLQQDNLLRCIDLAGRFAVALASVEREEALYRQAHFDELTGLPNRQLLKDRLEQQIANARRDNFSGALLFLDLDRFKEINDVFGHSVGDIVLMQAAERIENEVRDSDTVARLGGDEFVVVLPRISSDSLIHHTAARLLDRLTESFSVRGHDHFVGGSIGIVTFPQDGDSVETLLKNADAAMYRAKESGRARFEFFSKKLNAESRRKIGLERDLRTAFQQDELHVYLQPQFDISTGVISGAEALMRWYRGDEGFVDPAEFVPLAEESGLIVELGNWVIEQTCLELRRILNKRLHPGSVSINVSARQLREPSFADDLISTLRKFDIHPGYLTLEVTESVVAQNRDTAIGILNTVRAEGVQVAIDDFGTGYSSLSYLQQLPFDVIKIDKSFVERIGVGEPSNNICRTIIKMAHELGKTVIAEGVEKDVQLDFLKENGCDFVQGFFYSEALNQDAFIAFIEKQDDHTQRRKALEIVRI